MRNLAEGNKINFSIFAIIVVVILIIIISAVTTSLKAEKEEYSVTEQACVYDKKYNYISLENPAKITKKWTGSYYLEEENTKKEYELGKYAVSFDSLKYSLDLFGKFYEVQRGGDVSKITEHNVIKNSNENKFFKIDDRKYLVVGKSIKNNTGTLSTKNYLIIIIDKLGNALLLNNEVNLKTINEMIISTSSFDFDVANEILKFENENIDLKKIIGSTNEYIPSSTSEKEKDKEEEKKEDEEKEDENGEKVVASVNEGATQTPAQTTTVTTTTTNNDTTVETSNNNETTIIQNNNDSESTDNSENSDDSENTTNNSNNNNNNNANNNNNNDNSNSNNNNNNNNNNNSGNNDQSNSGSGNNGSGSSSTSSSKSNTIDTSWVESLNEWIGTVASGFQSIYNGSNNKKDTSSLVKSITLNGLTPGATYLDIDYSVEDPENKYNVVYATVSSVYGAQDISLDKNNTSYRVTGLEPNTNYTVSIGYKIIHSDSTTEENIEDSMTARTKTSYESLEITKITTSKIYYKLKLDSSIPYDNAYQLVVYVNDEPNLDIVLNNNDITVATSVGYTGSFNIPEEYSVKKSTLRIQLEEIGMSGKIINNNLTSKIVNY